MRVLYDGWSLIHDPLSPASLHLHAILENIPPQVDPFLALPGNSPGYLDFCETEHIPTPGTPWGKLRWEQSYLPSLAKKLDIQLLHLVTPTAPALMSLDTVFSPTGFCAGSADWSGIKKTSADRAHFIDRVRISLGLGGLARNNKIMWPDDLPLPAIAGSIESIPPVLPSKFARDPAPFTGGEIDDLPQDLRLPDEFILYHGPGGRQVLDLLLQAWNWAAGAIGEYYPLLLVGLDDQDFQVVSQLENKLGIADSLLVLPAVTPAILHNLYQLSAAVFHPAPASPWCGPVRLALASGKPLVAAEGKLSAAIAGPAAYLVKGNDARALGAALVTVVVEREMADRLSAAGKHRARDWVSNDFGEQLLVLYSGAHRLG